MNKKTDMTTVLLWAVLAIVWAVLVFMDIRAGFPSPVATALKCVCALSSVMAAVRNYNNYKNGK